ncbi:hypothetical protein ACTXT7_008008 [Hymenolepis weldensis]
MGVHLVARLYHDNVFSQAKNTTKGCLKGPIILIDIRRTSILTASQSLGGQTGVVVFWNVSDSESEEIINKFRNECNRPIALELVEFEELVYSFTSGPTVLDVEDIRLRAVPTKSDSKESQEVYEKEIQRLVMEKIAFSDALAASEADLTLNNSFDKCKDVFRKDLVDIPKEKRVRRREIN